MWIVLYSAYLVFLFIVHLQSVLYSQIVNGGKHNTTHARMFQNYKFNTGSISIISYAVWQH